MVQKQTDGAIESLAALLSPDPWTRLAAAESLSPAEPAHRYALRSALLGDTDARVRAQAAETLGAGPRGDDVTDWLSAGLGDPLPSVREACLRALGQKRASGAASECARLATADPVWWVRRSALLALAAVAETAAISTLRSALGDPFWRVRYAAVQALTLLAAAHPAERARILVQDERSMKPVAAAALWYLRAQFDASIDVHKFRLHERPDEALWNADPAVITARLRAQSSDSPGSPGSIGPRELVSYLGDPHEPLRALASKRLRASADLATLREALRHLEVPGMPHALPATWALLDSLGDRAQELAASVLGDCAATPSALSWAASWTVRARCEDLYAALSAQARHPESQARAVIAQALAHRTPLDVVTLLELLGDDDADVRSAAALGLCRSEDEAATRALKECDLASHAPAVRAAFVAHAARRGDQAALQAAARDPHPYPRQLALAELAHLGAVPNLAECLRDPDPWIRAAVLRAAPTAWLTIVAGDADVAVRRRALQLAVASRHTMAATERSALAHAACTAGDPWLRAQGCELFATERDEDVQALLDLTRDPAPMVRAAASAVLDGMADSEKRLRGLLAESLTASQRAAAYARLLRELDEPATALLLDGLSASSAELPLVREQLRAIALLLPDELRHALPAAERTAIAALEAPPASQRRPPAGPALAPRRPLGRTGVLVSPLALSGAQDLPLAALADAHRAGVNTFFWEPGYAQLTRFLRGRRDRRELVIVGGTYEGDKVGIERDLKRALHRLRTDYLDVFLLFWTRSPERLSTEALATLTALKKAGRIRAFGFSTHDRGLAATAIESGDWEVVMTRHSAAHPGAEDRLLPLCAERGIGVLTFSALCYTRLLRPTGAFTRAATPADAPTLPTAADCYRYSLSQPGVSACLSAPRNFRELRENLTVLAEPHLAPDRQEALRAHGRTVRDENRRFDALLRKGHEGNQEAPAPQQLGELLALLMESSRAPELELRESLQTKNQGGMWTSASPPRA